jgi:hypothetical protein
MAAPRPSVTITLDKERALTLDMRALFRAEGRLRELKRNEDLQIFDLLQSAQRRKKLGLTEVAVLLWAGLSVADPALTEDEVLAMMGPGTIAVATAAISKSLTAFFSERRADAAPASDGPLPGSPGSSGGPSPGTTSDSATRSSGG